MKNIAIFRKKVYLIDNTDSGKLIELDRKYRASNYDKKIGNALDDLEKKVMERSTLIGEAIYKSS